MTKSIKLVITKITTWKLLRVYATIMSTIFLGIWSVAMYNVVVELINTFFPYIK